VSAGRLAGSRQLIAVQPLSRVLLENGREDKPVRATTVLSNVWLCLRALGIGSLCGRNCNSLYRLREIRNRYTFSRSGRSHSRPALRSEWAVNKRFAAVVGITLMISMESLILAQDERWRRA